MSYQNIHTQNSSNSKSLNFLLVDPVPEQLALLEDSSNSKTMYFHLLGSVLERTLGEFDVGLLAASIPERSLGCLDTEGMDTLIEE